MALILTRQGLPTLQLGAEELQTGFARGAYAVADAESPDVVLLASGSEVSLALEAAKLLAEVGVAARVVSMPSWELFDAQPEEYRQDLLLPGVPKVAVEAGIAQGWYKYVGAEGGTVTVDRYGASAPYKVVMQELGLTPENVAKETLRVLGR